MESVPSILPLTVAVVATGHIQKRTRANGKPRPDRAGAEFVLSLIERGIGAGGETVQGHGRGSVVFAGEPPGPSAAVTAA